MDLPRMSKTSAPCSLIPYHHVEDGAAYPAVLLLSGDADTRCNPMHARKMAARLQAASGSGYPILLDYKRAWDTCRSSLSRPRLRL